MALVTLGKVVGQGENDDYFHQLRGLKAHSPQPHPTPAAVHLCSEEEDANQKQDRTGVKEGCIVGQEMIVDGSDENTSQDTKSDPGRGGE